jgi:carbon storage regulator
MLVLSRKIDESLMIADNIELIIIDIIGDRVKIGINAPKDVKVLRSEIYDKLNDKKQKINK